MAEPNAQGPESGQPQLPGAKPATSAASAKPSAPAGGLKPSSSQTKAKTQAAARTGSAEGPIEMLKADHRKVEALITSSAQIWRQSW